MAQTAAATAGKTKSKRAKAKPARKAAGKSAAKSHAKSPSNDAIVMLKDDHQKVSALFRQYDQGKNKLSPTAKQKIAAKICDELKVHTRIEEELFYPAVSAEVPGCEDMLAEARVEHTSLKRLMADIAESTPGSEEYDADVKVLGEYVHHHVEEEHEELFPKVRKSAMDLKALGTTMRARKKELMGKGEDAGPEEIFGGAFAG